MKRTSPKSRIYESIYALNAAAEILTSELKKLGDGGVLPARVVIECRDGIEEIRAQANCRIHETLRELELRDWTRYGSRKQRRIESAKTRIPPARK
jgi:hypothetical protein